MISGGVEISIDGGGGEMVFFFFFFLFFCNHALFVSRYKKPYAAPAMKRKKPINANHCPLHLFMGKIKHPKSIGKVCPAGHLRYYTPRHVRKQ